MSGKIFQKNFNTSTWKYENPSIKNSSNISSLKKKYRKKYAIISAIISIIVCVLVSVIIALSFFLSFKDKLHGHHVESINAKHEKNEAIKRLEEDKAKERDENKDEIRKVKEKSDEDIERFKTLLNKKNNELILLKEEIEKEKLNSKTLMINERKQFQVLKAELERTNGIAKVELMKKNEELNNRYNNLDTRIKELKTTNARNGEVLKLLQRDGIVDETFAYHKGAPSLITLQSLWITSLITALVNVIHYC